MDLEFRREDSVSANGGGITLAEDSSGSNLGGSVDGQSEGTGFVQTKSRRPSETQTEEHPLRRRWQFLYRVNAGRKSRGQSGDDWQKEMVQIGPPVFTIEGFWVVMREVLRLAKDGSVFMFQEGIQPMWEDPHFAAGGSINLSFGGPDYQENAEQAFLLGCLLLIGCQFDPNDHLVCGCTLGAKGPNSRAELWTSTDDQAMLSTIATTYMSSISKFHLEFFQNLSTKVAFDMKAFKSGGDRRNQENLTIEKIVTRYAEIGN